MTPTRARLTATERSAQVLRAAVTAFSESGYTATKTDEIARLAGVSQPYVIRLFGSKQNLFIAAVHQVCDRIEQVFREAGATIAPATEPAAALEVLGHGYKTFLTERELLLLLLHGFAASTDPVIGADVRDRFGGIYQLVGALSGGSAVEVKDFVSHGMLLTVLAAMRVVGPDAVPTPWAADIVASLTDDQGGC